MRELEHVRFTGECYVFTSALQRCFAFKFITTLSTLFHTHKTTKLCNVYRFVFSESINSQSNPMKFLLCSKTPLHLHLCQFWWHSYNEIFLVSLRCAIAYIIVRDVCCVASQMKMQSGCMTSANDFLWLSNPFSMQNLKDKTSNNSTF